MRETNEERMERIKGELSERFRIVARRSGKSSILNFIQDIQWLIEQAEHSQKLWQLANERGTNLSSRSHELHWTKEENKELREALAFYADYRHYHREYDCLAGDDGDYKDSIIDEDSGRKANMALRRESENMSQPMLTVKELIEELQKQPDYAVVRVLKEYDNGLTAYGYADKVTLDPIDEDDNYLERYVTIKSEE